MSALLAIESSGPGPAIALARHGRVVFESRRSPPSGRVDDLAALVRHGLRQSGMGVRDIERVGVNAGPGGLGAVRGGVAFANALTYAAGKPLLGFSFFEIAGRQVAGRTARTVVSAIPAAGDNAYLGLFRNGAVEAMAFGDPRDLAPRMLGDLKEIWVAGRLRGRIGEWLPTMQIHDAGFDSPDPKTILSLLETGAGACPPPPWAHVEPINETSRIFHVGA